MENKAYIKASTPAEQHRFHFLDALRGIAAVLVIPRHAPDALGHSLATHNSFLAVDFFFCLSGFVIAFSYESRLADTLRWRDFVITRVIRLYPIAIVATLIGVLGNLLDHSASAHHLPAKFVLPLVVIGCLILPLPHNLLFPFDTPMWTLFLEFWANLVYGAMIRARSAGSRLLGFFCVSSLVMLVVARHKFGTLDVGFTSQRLWAGVARVFLSFFIGVLLYRIYKRKRLPRLKRGRAILAGCLLVLFFAAVLLANPPGPSGVFELLSITVAFPIIIFAGADIALPGSWTAICAFLGTISYPLYLFHQPFLVLCAEVQIHFGRASATTMTLYFLALMAFSWIVARVYDTPVRRALTRIAKRYQKPRLAAEDVAGLPAASDLIRPPER